MTNKEWHRLKSFMRARKNASHKPLTMARRTTKNFVGKAVGRTDLKSSNIVHDCFINKHIGAIKI